jgi:bacteriophage HK97-gp10 putative tail-component
MSRYKPNHEDFGRFMLSVQMQKPITAVAEVVKADAVENTPEATGAMKSDYEVNDIKVTVNKGPRVAAEVRNGNPAAPAVEFGGKRNKPVRPLGRAAAKHGDVRGEG